MYKKQTCLTKTKTSSTELPKIKQNITMNAQETQAKDVNVKKETRQSKRKRNCWNDRRSSSLSFAAEDPHSLVMS